MNRWLKYSGNITSNQSGWYTSDIYLKTGKYKIKIISNRDHSGNFYARIHRYNLNRVWRNMLVRYVSTAPTPINKIWHLEFTITEDSYIRFSIRNTLSILEIEKL